MAESMLSYDKSPTPPTKPGGIAGVGGGNPDRSIRVDDRGEWQYDSASASGHVEVYIPALPGSPNATERLHVKDFPSHIIGKIEASMNRQPYMKVGATQRPHQVFSHYVSVAKGAKLLDDAALGRMDTLAREFAESDDQQAYFGAVLRPYLNAFTTKRR